jgi:hypothetical protein
MLYLAKLLPLYYDYTSAKQSKNYTPYTYVTKIRGAAEKRTIIKTII